MPYSNQYVQSAHTTCTMQGCQYQESVRILHMAQQVLDEAKRIETEGRKRIPVASEWCETRQASTPEGHPFNGKAGKVIVTREIHWPMGAVEESEPVTYCLRHGKEMGLVHDPKDDIVSGEIEQPLFGEDMHDA